MSGGRTRSRNAWKVVLAAIAVALGMACSGMQRSSGAPDEAPASTTASTGTVTVRADGTFEPASIEVRAGDTVTWSGLDLLQSVIEVGAPSGAACPNALPYADGSLTGPPRHGIPGLYSRATADTPPAPEVWTWPELAGVLLVVDWNRVERAPDAYDWARIDETLDAATRSGKVVSLAIRAGIHGTPDWVFDQGGAKPVHVQEYFGGDPPEGATDCGPRGRVGSPADPAYLEHWLDLWRAFGAHVRSRGDRWQSLGRVELGGMNHISPEVQLARTCRTACPCNTRAWAEAGYTPEVLYRFFDRVMEVLKAELPGKSVGYALLQDGLPSVAGPSNWRGDGNEADDIRPVLQTEEILRRGERILGPYWIPMHHGLRPTKTPNRWVREAGQRGLVTGLQTTNEKKGVDSWEDVEASLRRLVEESDAVIFEGYEDVLADARRAWGSSKTLTDWAAALRARRPEAHPPTWSHTLTTAGNRWFVLTPACHVGQVTVR